MNQAQYEQDLKLIEKSAINKRYGFTIFQKPLINTYQFKLSVHCADISRNHEYLVCGCGRGIIIVYDLINKKSILTSGKSDNLKLSKMISVSFSFYYDYVLAGDNHGNLLIFKLTTHKDSFNIDFLKCIEEFHSTPLFFIQVCMADLILTSSSNTFQAHFLSQLILTEDYRPITKRQLSGNVCCKVIFTSDTLNLFFGLKNGEVLQSSLSNIDQAQKTNLNFISFKSNYQHQVAVSAIAVSQDLTLLAVGYQSKENEKSYLTIYYLKRRVVVFQTTNPIAEEKISALQFFEDLTHLVICAWDGSFQILNIPKKQILAPYTSMNLHPQGIINLFFTQEDKSFPTMLTVGQEHIIMKTYFGNIKENLLDYIPFIFWVELRIRQELAFKTELFEYLKSLFLGSVGVDYIKRQEQTYTIIGFEFFGPLLKRVIDYEEYEQRNPALFKKYKEGKQGFQLQKSQSSPNDQQDQTQKKKFKMKLQPLQHKLEPISMKLEPIKENPEQDQNLEINKKNSFEESPPKNNRMISSVILDKKAESDPPKNQKISSERNLDSEIIVNEDDETVFLFDKIIETIDLDKIQILNLTKCSFLFADKLPFKRKLIDNIVLMPKLKYLDLSYNLLHAQQAADFLSQLHQSLEFLSLAHNQLGENKAKKYQQMTAEAMSILLEKSTQITMRSNGFSDTEGEMILNNIKFFTQLTILDLSGNLEFGEKTFIALQRITVLQNKLNFKERQNKDLFQMFKHLSFLENNQFFDQKSQDLESHQGSQIKDEQFNDIQIDQDDIKQKPEGEQSKENDPQILQDENAKLIQPNIEEEKQYDRVTSISSNKSNVDISLQLLCLQYKPEKCEEAQIYLFLNLIKRMKTATDFLVHNKIPNLYVYIVDNKIDNVWESSISVFYTRDVLSMQDHFKQCCFAYWGTFCSGLWELLKTFITRLLYCLKACLCSTLFLYKYLLCFLCTFLTSAFGSWLVTCFGLKDQVYEYNNQYTVLEEGFQRKTLIISILFLINFLGYFFVCIFLPIHYVSKCKGLNWMGHYMYLVYFGFSFILEITLFIYSISFDVTKNQYTEGSKWNQYFYRIKDLLLSQLSKFDLYSDVCFIMIVLSCKLNLEIAYVAIAVVGLAILIEIFWIFRTLIRAITNSISKIDFVQNYCSFMQIHLVSNLLEKWTVQNHIYKRPQKLVITFFKAFFQDIPSAALQIAYLIMNPEKAAIQILIVSLISSILHALISVIKFLSTSKTNRINDQVMINEIGANLKINKENLENSNVVIPLNQKISMSQEQLKTQAQLINYNKLQVSCIQDSNNYSFIDPANYYQDRNMSKKHNKVVPIKKMRKGVTEFQELGETKNEKIDQNLQVLVTTSYFFMLKSQDQEFNWNIFIQQQIIIKSFGSQLRDWSLTEMEKEIVEALLLDVNKADFIQEEQFWAQGVYIGFGAFASSPFINTSMLHYFYPYLKKIKNPRILDLGFGSGLSTMYLAKVTEKLQPNSEMQQIFNLIIESTILALDSVPQLVNNFKQTYQSKYYEPNSKLKITIEQFDCLNSVSEKYGKQCWDIVYVGFGMRQSKFDNDLKFLLSEGGIMLGGILYMSQNSHGFIYKGEENLKMIKENQHLHYFNIGSIMEPTLQMSNDDHSLKVNLKYYDECVLCQVPLGKGKGQFINPFWNESICLKCGMEDHSTSKNQNKIENFKYGCNVIYWSGRKENTLRDIYGHKIGKNKQPKFGKPTGRTHRIRCNGCGKQNKGGFRYICLECAKEEQERDAEGYLDLCYTCQEAVITQEIAKEDPTVENKLELPNFAQDSRFQHNVDHAMLRVIFSFGYDIY